MLDQFNNHLKRKEKEKEKEKEKQVVLYRTLQSYLDGGKLSATQGKVYTKVI